MWILALAIFSVLVVYEQRKLQDTRNNKRLQLCVMWKMEYRVSQRMLELCGYHNSEQIGPSMPLLIARILGFLMFLYKQRKWWQDLQQAMDRSFLCNMP